MDILVAKIICLVLLGALSLIVGLLPLKLRISVEAPKLRDEEIVVLSDVLQENKQQVKANWDVLFEIWAFIE